jgi:hypothetical protein
MARRARSLVERVKWAVGYGNGWNDTADWPGRIPDRTEHIAQLKSTEVTMMESSRGGSTC